MDFYLPMSRKRNRFKQQRYGVDRRFFLQYLAALSSIPQVSLFAQSPIEKEPKFTSDPFTLGVSSGDPTSHGVVLWTRLSAGPLEISGLPRLPAAHLLRLHVDCRRVLGHADPP